MLGAWLLLTCALAYLILEVRRYYIDVPFWDEWVLLPLIERARDGTLTLGDLSSWHNEHRPFFPRLALLSIALKTDWNLWYECMASMLLGVVSAAGLLELVRRTVPAQARTRPLCLVVVGVMTLSMNQWENWLWGWQLEVFLNVLAVVMGLALLSTGHRPPSLVAASACGIVATYSFASGLLYWVAAVPVVWRRPLRQKLAWLAIATVTTLGYVSGWRRQPEDGTDVLSSSVLLVRTLGASLVNESSGVIAGLTGAFGLLVFAVSAWRLIRACDRASALAVWLALAAYGLGNAILVGLGRPIFFDQPIPSRYVTFSNLFWVGICLAFMHLHRRWAALVLLVPCMATWAALEARPTYVARKASLTNGRFALYAPVGNHLVSRFFWDPAYVRAQLEPLRRLRLSLYDCEGQLSRGDWTAAAEILATRAGTGDTVIASNQWAEECLAAAALEFGLALDVSSAGESEAQVTSLLGSSTRAFFVTGGDLESYGARAWMESHGYPLYRSPIGSMRLLYYPDQESYIQDRLTPAEIVEDGRRFRQLGDLVSSSAPERLFLRGWVNNGVSRVGGARAIFGDGATLYVPVVDAAPRSLLVEFRPAPGRPLPQQLVVLVNGVAAHAAVLDAARATLDIPLFEANWRAGGNVVALMFPGGTPPPGDEGPVVLVQRLAFDHGNR